MLQKQISVFRNGALKKPLAVILVGVVLVAGLVGCDAREASQVREQPASDSVQIIEEEQAAVDFEPPESVAFEEASVESEGIEDGENDVGHVTSEFTPDWDAIERRAAELADFFEAGMVDGISLDDAIRELESEPVWVDRGYHSHAGRGYLIPTDTHVFSLITRPGYIPIPHHYAWISTKNEHLLSGDVGIIVRLTIHENEDFTRSADIIRKDINIERSSRISTVWMPYSGTDDRVFVTRR